MTPYPHSTTMPSKLALLNYHHQTQSGLQVGFQTSTFPQVRTEPSLPMVHSPASTQPHDLFLRPPVTSSPPARLLSPSTMKGSEASHRQHQTPPQTSRGLLQSDTPSLRSPVSLLSVYSDAESVHSQASSHTTAGSEWAPANGNSHVRHPSHNTTFSQDRGDVDAAMEEVNPDTALESRIPVRKIKTSVLDRPRPIARGCNATFSAPHAESDRLVQTVLKNSKSFDRGRRYWLAPPEHASVPPVPAIPSVFDEAKKLKRQSSMINLPSLAYNARDNNDYVGEANFDHNTRLFDDRAPSLVLTDPSIYEATPTVVSIPRRQLKDVIPHSLRKLKPKKGLHYN